MHYPYLRIYIEEKPRVTGGTRQGGSLPVWSACRPESISEKNTINDELTEKKIPLNPLPQGERRFSVR
jgi:hypothetical protein